MRKIIIAISVALASQAAAAKLACNEEPATLQYLCIDTDAVRVNGDVRSSPLYKGGRNKVDKTPYYVLTNCAKNISTLQDSQGVNFAGGFSSSTPAMADLSRWMCEAPKPRKDPSLRMF